MIVADENIEQYWISLLRMKGYDVLSIREKHAGISDRDVIAIAKYNKGILLTEDKDFGELVFAHGIKGLSIVLLRYDQPNYHQIESAVLNIIGTFHANPQNCFITITASTVRVRSI